MRVPLAILVAAILVPAPLVLAGTVRSESHRYLGAPGDFATDCGQLTDDRLGLGGACFATQHTREARLRLAVDDDRVSRTAASYQIVKGSVTYGEGHFCDAITLVLPDLPPPVTVLVYVQEAFAPMTCAAALPATTGWIDAQFLTAT